MQRFAVLLHLNCYMLDPTSTSPHPPHAAPPNTQPSQQRLSTIPVTDAPHRFTLFPSQLKGTEGRLPQPHAAAVPRGAPTRFPRTTPRFQAIAKSSEAAPTCTPSPVCTGCSAARSITNTLCYKGLDVDIGPKPTHNSYRPLPS